MTLKDYRTSFEYFSSKVSEANFQLGVSGVALVWLLRGPVDTVISQELLKALQFLVLSIVTHFLHYLIGTATWGGFCRLREKQGLVDNSDTDAPRWLNWPIIILFWAKSVLMIIGFYHIGKAMKLI